MHFGVDSGRTYMSGTLGSTFEFKLRTRWGSFFSSFFLFAELDIDIRCQGVGGRQGPRDDDEASRFRALVLGKETCYWLRSTSRVLDRDNDACIDSTPWDGDVYRKVWREGTDGLCQIGYSHRGPDNPPQLSPGKLRRDGQL